MGYKVFANNALLTAAEVNDYLMKQAVIICTNQAEQNAIPVDGTVSTIFRSDTAQLKTLRGGSFKPVGGLCPIIPGTPVPTGAGSSAAVGAGGKVTFGLCTALGVPNIFNADFENYRVLMDIPTSAANQSIVMQLALAGVADTTATNYDNTSLTGVGATATSGQAIATASWTILPATSNTNRIVDIEMEFKRPNLAAPTEVICTGLATLNPMTSAGGVAIKALQHRASTAYDGLVFTFATGTPSGTLRAYGWNNN